MAVSNEARHLEIESWTLFGCTIFFVIARMVSRRLLLQSWRRLKIDDYLMLLATITYTNVIVFVNETAQNLDNYLPDGVYETFSPQDVKNAIFGSKCVFITEEFILATLWLCKACLLILYSSLTLGLPKQHRLVKYVGGYCVFGYILTQILFLGVWCRPIQQYWWVPVQNKQCASYYHHLITASVFNISSDLMMLLIPIPLLIKARLPRKRKIVLVGIFSLGIFVVLASILNRYYNFTEPYGSLVYLNWYAGESSTAIMVANVPHCWPIVARIFRLGNFKSYGPSGAGGAFGSTPAYGTGGGENSSAAHNKRSRFSSAITSMGSRTNNGYIQNTHSEDGEDRDSIERIIRKGVVHGKDDSVPGAHTGTIDLELGPVPHAVSTPAAHAHAPPEYEAHASADNARQTFWTSGPRPENGGAPTGAHIVKTVQVDQHYES